uniref:Uncharacterized protein n=1 Tax=Chromulina nebulosa TaxID=96789 RepID=A0A7S0SUE0_9STRA
MNGLGLQAGSSGPWINKFDSSIYQFSSHPYTLYNNFEYNWLIKYSSLASFGHTDISITPLYIKSIRIPLIRCDIINMTRYVHHHYDYSKDGHTRTYTMNVINNDTITNDTIAYYNNEPHISTLQATFNNSGTKLTSPVDKSSVISLDQGYHINNNHVVKVGLFRDKDSFFIPYTMTYGVTLISILRLGLIQQQQSKYFKSFLKLNLYEDMAPWNIVVTGQTVDYIDFDTKEFIFDQDIPKAYQIMSVLMNYKRTVEDFKRCGAKSSTVYGLPYVSDCIGKVDSSLKCSDMKKPVPCGDGTCHSDYISCLRSMAGNN